MYDCKARTRGAGGNAMKVQVVYGQWSTQSGGSVVENLTCEDTQLAPCFDLKSYVSFILLATIVTTRAPTTMILSTTITPAT